MAVPRNSTRCCFNKEKMGGEYACPGGVGGPFETGWLAVGPCGEVSAVPAGFWVARLGVSVRPGWEHPAGLRGGLPPPTPQLQQGRSRPPGPPALMEGAGGWRAPWSLLAGLCLLFASHLHLGPGWPRGSGHLAWEPGQRRLWGLLGRGELPVPPPAPARCWVLPSLMSAGRAPLALRSAR